jgi:hypothetical protein
MAEMQIMYGTIICPRLYIFLISQSRQEAKGGIMIDRYTKFILTVIAASLVIIILRDVPILREAFAAEGPVAVTLRDQPIKVTISDIDCPSCTWDPLQVKVAK